MTNPIDARLLALYNEYLSNGKEEEFLEMLYAILDQATPEVRRHIAARVRMRKSKETRRIKKETIKKVEDFFAKMTYEERIEFLNKPWEELPDWIREIYPRLVKYPEEFNFLRIAEEVGKEERQNEIFGARLLRYIEKHRIITTNKYGNVEPDCKRMSEICNELAEKYDLARRPGHKAQHVRVTPSDIKHYTMDRITPKKDKLVTIKMVTDLPMWYLGGYRGNNPPDSGDHFFAGVPSNNSPYDPGPFSGKFRKGRKVPDGGDAA